MSEAIIKRWTSHNFNRPSVQIKDKPKIFENYIHNRRAKFALLTRGEFGSFFVALKHIANKHISYVGCRSPPYQSFLKTNKNKIDMEEKLNNVLDKLSSDEKKLIDLHYFANISKTQLAEKYHVNQSTISRRLEKIRSKFKKYLEK